MFKIPKLCFIAFLQQRKLQPMVKTYFRCSTSKIYCQWLITKEISAYNFSLEEEISKQMGRKRTFQVAGLIMEWSTSKRHHGCWNSNCRQEQLKSKLERQGSPYPCKCLICQVISHLIKKTGCMYIYTCIMYIYIHHLHGLPSSSFMKLECRYPFTFFQYFSDAPVDLKL